MQIRKYLYGFLLTALPFVLFAQNEVNPPAHIPHEGVEGKDVIWWPTSQALVRAMLDKARVGPGDFVVDLGSGDGRIVIEAAKRGAVALGIEYNPDLVALSKYRAQEAGVGERATFLNMDLFEYDLSKATVVSMYLLTELNMRLRPALFSLKPGTRIVSNTFDLGDWNADENIHADNSADHSDDQYRLHGTTSMGYLWIVPAKVQGSWTFRDGKLSFSQSFQVIEGTFRSGEKTVKLENARLSGEKISFTLEGVNYTGTVEGKRMKGTLAGGSQSWEAVMQ